MSVSRHFIFFFFFFALIIEIPKRHFACQADSFVFKENETTDDLIQVPNIESGSLQWPILLPDIVFLGHH